MPPINLRGKLSCRLSLPLCRETLEICPGAVYLAVERCRPTIFKCTPQEPEGSYFERLEPRGVQLGGLPIQI